MAAAVNVEEATGAGPTWTIITAARFCTADSAAPGTANPIPIPAAGTKYSYWKTHALHFSGAFTQVTNIKFYTDGVGYASGVISYIGVDILTRDEAEYVQASGAVGDSGAEMVASHTNIGSKVLLFTFTSASPKVIDSGPITSGRCNAIVLQMDIGATASAGELTDETLSWRYDEI